MILHTFFSDIPVVTTLYDTLNQLNYEVVIVPVNSICIMYRLYINDINYTLEIINDNAITKSTLNNTDYMFILSINNVSQIKTKSIIDICKYLMKVFLKLQLMRYYLSLLLYVVVIYRSYCRFQRTLHH